MTREWVRPAIATGSALAAVGAVTSDVGNPLRGALVAWFLLVGPGLTVVNLLRIRGPLIELVATFAVSMALGVAVAETLLYLGWWSPRLGLVILSSLTVALAVISLVSPRGSRPAPAQGLL
jgi:hypothetical protein